MGKEEFLNQVEQSSLLEEDKQIWRKAVEFLSPDILAIIGEKLNQDEGLEEMTAEIKKHQEAVLNHVGKI